MARCCRNFSDRGFGWRDRPVMIVHALGGPIAQSFRVKGMRHQRPWAKRFALASVFLAGLWLLSLLRVDATEEIEAQPLELRVKRPVPRRSVQPYAEPIPVYVPKASTAPVRAEVQVHVIDSSGLPASNVAVRVSGCEDQTRVGGPVLAFDLEAGASCRFQAARRDGLLLSRSDLETRIVDGGPNTIILELPSTRTGGIGVQFQPHEEGMQVLWVMPGTPAARAGLAAGDVVLEVGGVPASTLESDAFIGLMTGPEGSEVDFLVGFESEEGFVEEEVTVIRQFLDG